MHAPGVLPASALRWRVGVSARAMYTPTSVRVLPSFDGRAGRTVLRDCSVTAVQFEPEGVTVQVQQAGFYLGLALKQASSLVSSCWVVRRNPFALNIDHRPWLRALSSETRFLHREARMSVPFAVMTSADNDA